MEFGLDMGIQPVALSPALVSALSTAGDKSGVDFNYLLNTAERESSLDPTAKNPKSSALGLFQFLDATWLQVMKQEGPRLGYQRYADAITIAPDGGYTVKDGNLRAEILKLRENPQVSADLAAAFTRDNGQYLMDKFGRMPSPGELYIAHFLGAQGAERLFAAGLQNPDQSAAALFPAQAAGNRRIFYDSHGRARSIREVYQVLVGQQQGAPAFAAVAVPAASIGFAAQQMAASPVVPEVRPGVPPGGDVPLPSRIGPQPDGAAAIGPENMSFTTLFSTTTTGATGSPLLAPAAQGEGALFTQIYGQGRPHALNPPPASKQGAQEGEGVAVPAGPARR
jgi:hypothetical protein